MLTNYKTNQSIAYLINDFAAHHDTLIVAPESINCLEMVKHLDYQYDMSHFGPYQSNYIGKSDLFLYPEGVVTARDVARGIPNDEYYGILMVTNRWYKGSRLEARKHNKIDADALIAIMGLLERDDNGGILGFHFV